ncbi:hypothetical protein [Spirillospora sp. NBC_01491]|uniref:hypothetical protein n=1 Tax=Spirillospora sp. NBC_01491 TaxID=2976007 RepID=UPI002E331B5F|nr:hypothetical protein [Spirillospora sp. NBC_01491]
MTTWLPSQQLEDSSVKNYRHHIEQRINPWFGERTPDSITDPGEIRLWEMSLRGRFAGSTPLQLLLTAERIALLTGRDIDLAMWVLCACAGCAGANSWGSSGQPSRAPS